ncbi:hypothetical protein [Massilia genomosp. 1]|uniref:Uncharacterized protein n=1 Tax=Massilia genomosp. 1 TaxID=2609280 RepID=A0ABX0MSG5_9BURK|nr:hypothetical protein [Massilia genomosp. 1]NHZ62254.1 hypothetical protein [Massilia genomosp. 1]
MGRYLDDVINSLPAERKTAIATDSRNKFDEMLAYAAQRIRKDVDKRQAQAAKNVSTEPNPVSQAEMPSDPPSRLGVDTKKH